jgi:hypothetical protein
MPNKAKRSFGTTQDMIMKTDAKHRDAKRPDADARYYIFRWRSEDVTGNDGERRNTYRRDAKLE